MMAEQQFCLRWNNHQNTIISVFDSLLESEILVDCTLAAEGQYIRAHKVVLSACSPFFSDVLREHYEKHPILIMKDVKFNHLKAMLDYMYRGEVNISQDQLGTFLKAAESLQIKGLSDNSHNYDSANKVRSSPPSNRAPRPTSKISDEDPPLPRPKSTSPPPRKRKRRLQSESGEDVNEDSTSEPVVELNMNASVQPSVNSASPADASPAVASREENSSDELPGLNCVLPSSVSISYKNSSPRPSSMDSALTIQPKSEFVEVGSVEELTLEDENMEAGPSHSGNDPGAFTWHVDRSSEEPFLASQESLGGHRNAQASNKQPGSDSTIPWPDFHECPICGRLYKYRSTLYRHVRYECGGARMKLVCPICGRRFSRPDNLRQHALTHTIPNSESANVETN